jgi:presqualene diphosphate phosphatase
MALELSGSGFIWIPYVIIMLARHFRSAHDVMPFILLFAGLLLDIAIVGTIKGLTRRSRPMINHNDTISIGPDKYSFPSGHTSRAVFLLFYFVTTNFFPRMPASIIIVWLGSVVASRVLLGRHYVSDVLAGFLLGIVECSLLVRLSPLIRQTIFHLYTVV